MQLSEMHSAGRVKMGVFVSKKLVAYMFYEDFSMITSSNIEKRYDFGETILGIENICRKIGISRKKRIENCC